MRRVVVAIVMPACLAGCSLLAPPPAPERPIFGGRALALAAARQAIEPGRSTRADVAALLGPAEAIRFDSGWEAWVWRGQAAGAPARQPPAEFVVLFGPDGVVRKLRGSDQPPAAAP